MVLCTEAWTNENSAIDIAGFDCLSSHRQDALEPRRILVVLWFIFVQSYPVMYS